MRHAAGIPAVRNCLEVVTNKTADVRLVDCVLFDLYGTLLDIQLDEDSPALWAGLTTAVGSMGAIVDPIELRRRFLAILKDEGQRGREGFIMEPVFQRLLASFGIANEDIGRLGGVFRKLSLRQLTLRSYVVPLLDALHRSGSKTGIVSNTEAVLTRFDLDCFPILRNVGAIILSSDVGVRKPDPAILRMALERLKADAASAVFIGNDWAEDIVGAQRAGIRAIYLDERENDRNSVVTKVVAVVLHAWPTLEALVACLRTFGWKGGDR